MPALIASNRIRARFSNQTLRTLRERMAVRLDLPCRMTIADMAHIMYCPAQSLSTRAAQGALTNPHTVAMLHFMLQTPVALWPPVLRVRVDEVRERHLQLIAASREVAKRRNAVKRDARRLHNWRNPPAPKPPGTKRRGRPRVY